MIIAKRTFQQILGGAPFLISGACGLFRTEVLREVGLSDRTKVEDLDLTWTLVERGYKVRQGNFCIVYPQECHTLREEWRRWRRWIMGYAVCMRLHWRLLLTRFGLFSMLPDVRRRRRSAFALSARRLGARALGSRATSAAPSLLYPHWPGWSWSWSSERSARSTIARLGSCSWPAAIVYVMLAYAVWLIHGLKGLVTGREFSRDKPTRYAHVVA